MTPRGSNQPNPECGKAIGQMNKFWTNKHYEKNNRGWGYHKLKET